ncbi:MAG: DMT family transporter, partial [Chlamydiae bacterium]|nr:DMT family transporter [Chlamydiota bacterium]
MNMILGILSVITACFLWSFVFILPRFSPSFSPWEVTLGRFFFFGSFSLLLLLVRKRHLLQKSHLSFWWQSSVYGGISTLVCYGTSVFAMRNAGISMTTLLFGMSPLTISLYGNWKEREYPFKILILPALCLLAGALLLNQEALCTFTGSRSYVLGFIAALVSLAAWTWFAVANFRFLQKNKKLPSSDWGVMLGASSFILVLIAYFLLLITNPSSCAHHWNGSYETLMFFLNSAILGIISSWVSLFFWNYGSQRIPVTLAGQLTVFEMLFAFCLLFWI